MSVCCVNANFYMKHAIYQALNIREQKRKTQALIRGDYPEKPQENRAKKKSSMLLSFETTPIFFRHEVLL